MNSFANRTKNFHEVPEDRVYHGAWCRVAEVGNGYIGVLGNREGQGDWGMAAGYWVTGRARREIRRGKEGGNGGRCSEEE